MKQLAIPNGTPAIGLLLADAAQTMTIRPPGGSLPALLCNPGNSKQPLRHGQAHYKGSLDIQIEPRHFKIQVLDLVCFLQPVFFSFS